MSDNRDFDFAHFEVAASTGMDALFSREPQIVSPTKRVRVASIQQLAGFERLSSETLIHKSDRDLWSIGKDAQGSLVIERMFDDNGAPLKG